MASVSHYQNKRLQNCFISGKLFFVSDILRHHVQRPREHVPAAGGHQPGTPPPHSPQHLASLHCVWAAVRNNLQGECEVWEQAWSQWSSLPPRPDSQWTNQTDCRDKAEGGELWAEWVDGHHHWRGGEPGDHDGDADHCRGHHQSEETQRVDQVRLWQRGQ